MVPHEFRMLWELSLSPETGGELACTLNIRDARKSYVHHTPGGVGSQLRRLVRAGLLERRNGIYYVTDLGRLYLAV